jgi:hypothetical protein
MQKWTWATDKVVAAKSHSKDQVGLDIERNVHTDLPLTVGRSCGFICVMDAFMYQMPEPHRFL